MSSVLLLDATDLGTLVVTGPDRQTWLNGLVTCDLKPLQPGQGAYGLALSKVGRILADLRILIASDRLVVGTSRVVMPTLIESMEKYLIMEECEIADRSGEGSWLELHGEGASALASEMTTSVGGVFATMDRSGHGGASIAIPTETRGEMLAWLEARGVRAASEAEWTAYRVQNRIPERGHEFDEKTYPQEASLERHAVSFNKGCYLGQEVVCMLEMRGKTQRKVVQIEIPAGASIEQGAQVTDDHGVPTGTVTTVSRMRSPGASKDDAARTPTDAAAPRALAMVKTANAASGTKVRIGDVTATVV